MTLILTSLKDLSMFLSPGMTVDILQMYCSLVKVGPLWIVHPPHPPPPQFCLEFLLRSRTYLKERPPTYTYSASIANRDFPLSSKHEDVVRMVYTHYKVQNMLLHKWFTLV